MNACFGLLLFFVISFNVFADSVFPAKYFSIAQDIQILLEETACESSATPCSVWYTLKNKGLFNQRAVLTLGEHRNRTGRCQIFFFPAYKKTESQHQSLLSYRTIILPAGESFEIIDQSQDPEESFSWFSAKNIKPVHEYDSDTISGVVIECRGQKARSRLDQGWFSFSDKPKTSLFLQ